MLTPLLQVRGELPHEKAIEERAAKKAVQEKKAKENAKLAPGQVLQVLAVDAVGALDAAHASRVARD